MFEPSIALATGAIVPAGAVLPAGAQAQANNPFAGIRPLPQAPARWLADKHFHKDPARRAGRPTLRDGKGDWTFCNLADDPAESTDLAAQPPQRVRAVFAAWRPYVDDNGVMPVSREIKPGARTCLYQHCFEHHATGRPRPPAHRCERPTPWRA